MSVESDVYFVLLPQFLKAFSPHRLFKGSFFAVPIIGGVTEDAMSDKDEPRLCLSVNSCKAMLYEFVLLRAFSPVVFTVRYTEPEHSVVCSVPELSSVLSRKVEHGLCGNTTLSSRIFTGVE